MNPQTCPICGMPLKPFGQEWHLDEILALWKPVVFSSETYASLAQQATHTRLYACACCEFEVFLPPIIGTGLFYEDLQTGPPYYVDDKWDFSEALKDFTAGQTLIELGCGPGAFLAKARDAGICAVGTEYNSNALHQAREKGLTVYSLNDDLTHLRESFDAAVSFHVLEHVRDPLAFLQTLADYVKPGGHIAVSVPNKFGAIRYVRPCASDMPPHHATHWSTKTLAAAGEHCGLRPLRFAYEPLKLKDAYYLDYWVKHRFEGWPLEDTLRRVASRLIPKAIHRLKQIGFQTFPGFKGMAVYVLFRKETTKHVRH